MKKYEYQIKMYDFAEHKDIFKSVRPTNAEPYQFKTKLEAIEFGRTWYPLTPEGEFKIIKV